jgi:DhnA family fructose-bisphosphate aldolase class Ia
MNSSYRKNRLFASDGRCVNVAVDHGFFNEPSFLAGIEDVPRTIADLIQAGPDAIQLPPGSAHTLQSLPSAQKPALVLRSDTANVYGKILPGTLHSELLPNIALDAVKLDAACVVVNLLSLPGQSELLAECVRNVAALRSECERYGMPLMVEPLVMQDNSFGGYMVDGDLDKIRALVRMAVELGADVIKCDPCDPMEGFSEVLRVASTVPVLVRGGGKTSDEEILARTEVLIRLGASGIVYGRNIIQHRNPVGMTQALMAIVHSSESAQQAAQYLS